jgi:hypothetical protein
MDGKKLIILAVGIIIVALVVLAAAFVVLSNNESPSATPTPAPEVTPAPTATASAATQGPTAKPAGSSTPAPGGPIIIQTNFNRTMNMCFVSMFLNTGASPVDTGSLKMDIVSGGQTYRNVWTLKTSDWASSDGDALLEPNEVLATQIDTKALGIPQGQPVTIRLVQDSAILQETTASPV